MKKNLLLAFTSIFIYSQSAQAHTVSVTNNTDSVIRVNVGHRNDWFGEENEKNTALVQPGQRGSIDVGGWCPWYVKISNADSSLSNAPLAATLNYPTARHCFSKTVTVGRRDDIKMQQSTATVALPGSGPASVDNKYVAGRHFIINSSHDFYTDSEHSQPVIKSGSDYEFK